MFQNDDALEIGDVSPDGRWLALVRNRTSADSDILLVDLASGEPTPRLITEHEGNSAHGVYTVTPDNPARGAAPLRAAYPLVTPTPPRTGTGVVPWRPTTSLSSSAIVANCPGERTSSGGPLRSI